MCENIKSKVNGELNKISEKDVIEKERKINENYTAKNSWRIKSTSQNINQQASSWIYFTLTETLLQLKVSEHLNEYDTCNK